MNRYPWLDEFLLQKAGAEKNYKVEWQWHRYLVGGKMFAAICQPDPKYKPHDGREMVILKCDPLMVDLLREKHKDIVPGFYSNKANWNSIYLDGDVPDDELKQMCSMSYDLVFSRLTKKLQREILGE